MPDFYPRPLTPPKPGTELIRVGLLGRGISGSLSPALHVRAAELAGLRLEFQLVDLDDPDQIGPELKRLHQARWRGLSVTMPYKRALETHLQGMSPEAISVGSVNLLLRSTAGWIGENSDVEGFLSPLSRRRLAFRSALVIGAGGAARAVLHVLASMPFVDQVMIRARRRPEADRLVEEFASEHKQWMGMGWGDPVPDAPDLIVNATPLGSEGLLNDELPCPMEWIVPECTCFDLVYQPRLTPFLKIAAARGAVRIEGLEMLTAQARRAFECWTGARFDEAALWREFSLDPAGAPVSPVSHAHDTH